MKKGKKLKIDSDFAKKVLKVVDRGLTMGIGEPEPGKMCVEAAVAFASGEKHTDRPSCVAPLLHTEKINLNDQNGWESDKDRANGLRRVAIAQLGSRDNFSNSRYRKLLDAETLKLIKNNLLTKARLKNIKEIADDEIQSLNDVIFNNRRKASNIKKALKKLSEAQTVAKLSTAMTSLNNAGIDTVDLGTSTVTEVSDVVEALYYIFPEQDEQSHLEQAAEIVTQVLKKMKVPGTKYLYLTEKGKSKRK